MYDMSLMTVGAHPDDEAGCSGCMTKYVERGGRAYVVCATRGDGVDAEIKDPAVATRETLGLARVEELRCACAKLGVESPIVLGFQDGEVDKVDTESAAQMLARLVRELKPTVVITHGPEGGYGHPDHIAVYRFTTRAVEIAGDPAVSLDLPPFAPAKLYYTAWPKSYLESVPGFRERRAMIAGRELTFLGVPDEQITTEVDIHPWLIRKLDALACHRTQFEMDAETGQPKTFASGLPEEQRLQFFGHERFVLARGPARSANGEIEYDLFAGIPLR